MSKLNFAVVDIFGRQFKVSRGDKIDASFIKGAETGEKLSFSKVFMLKKQDSLKIGTPFVENSAVTAEVISHKRSPKILVFKYLRKNKSKKMHGHRQPLTTLCITSIGE